MKVIDADNHYYEALDAFTRHLDPGMADRAVRWVEVDGRRYHAVGGRITRVVSNPTFDPIALPGALCDYLRGNPEGRPVGHYLSDLRSQVVLNQGAPSARGNLLGVQPELYAPDYQNVERLRLKLAAYLEKARSEGLLGPRTVVVFPEHIGTWLVAAGEKPEVYQARHLAEAMQWMAVSNPVKLARGWLIAKGRDRFTDALFRMKAVDMAHDYQTLFGGLARQFGVTLVAGSIVLPNPKVEDGVLVTGNGSLYNASLVFGSDGRPLGQPQRKVFPIDDEKPFIRAGHSDNLQVLDTPAGRLGVLICADSWYPINYAVLASEKVELLAVPAFLTGNGQWQQPWRGYNGARTPSDVQLKPGERYVITCSDDLSVR